VMILLVEDEEPIQQFIGDLLQEEGYEVHCADHGAQALEIANQAPPDLVLTDLMMPIMNGAELCRHLRSQESTRGVPIIVMSAAGREQADDSGADAFIGKPFDLDALLELVSQYAAIRG
jgi:CheY-like chemotaxis protein